MPKILCILLIIFLLSCNTETNNLKHWTYKIDYEFENTYDSIKPIGLIVFQRTRAIKDKGKEEIYKKNWIPEIRFEIFNISDLDYCKMDSSKTKQLSSCLSPNVGGDLIIVGNYIFLNRSVCIDCVGTENKIDYCRPIVNKILSDLHLAEDGTLREIDKIIGTKIERAE